MIRPTVGRALRRLDSQRCRAGMAGWRAYPLKPSSTIDPTRGLGSVVPPMTEGWALVQRNSETAPGGVALELLAVAHGVWTTEVLRGAGGWGLVAPGASIGTDYDADIDAVASAPAEVVTRYAVHRLTDAWEAPGSSLLLESGGHLLLESGGHMLSEAA